MKHTEIFTSEGICYISNKALQIIQARELSLMSDQNIQRALEKKWKGQLWMQYDATIIESFRELSVQTRQVDKMLLYHFEHI